MSAERLLGKPIPETWKIPNIAAAVENWRATDGLYAALQDLHAVLHRDSQSE